MRNVLYYVKGCPKEYIQAVFDKADEACETNNWDWDELEEDLDQIIYIGVNEKGFVAVWRKVHMEFEKLPEYVVIIYPKNED